MRKGIALIIVGLLMTAGASGCQKGLTEIPELQEPVDVKMDMAEVQREEICSIVTYEGEVVPFVEELSFSVDGVMGERYIELGDRVTAGQVLMTLDNESLEEEAERLEKEIQEILVTTDFDGRLTNVEIEILKEELVLLRENEAEETKILEKEREIQRVELAWKQEKELRNLELQKKQQNLAEVKEKIAGNRIQAPFDGQIVYIKDSESGDWVKNHVPMVYLVDDSRLSLTTDYITEGHLIHADRIYAKICDKEYELTYSPYTREEYIAMSLSGEKLDTRFVFEEQLQGVESGQFAAVAIINSYKEDVLTVPINALYREGSEWYVYKVVEKELVRCDVEVGVTTEIKAEIEEGLQEGDMVYVKN